MNRILWNTRPRDVRGLRGGDVDEVVLHHPKLVHIEQIADRAWWIGIYMDDDTYWMGNFIADSRGWMRLSEQENAGIEWEDDRSHERDDSAVTYRRVR